MGFLLCILDSFPLFYLLILIVFVVREVLNKGLAIACMGIWNIYLCFQNLGFGYL